MTTGQGKKEDRRKGMEPPSPQEQMDWLLTGYRLSQALYVAAQLGLADLLQDGPRTADDLAAASQVHPRSLYRLLRALGAGGRLPVVECVLLPGNEPSFGKLLDLAMLLIPGGQERTEQEYRRLFEAAGFRLTRIIPTQAEVSVTEGDRL